jgi:co-chaperonin GroES (HSP10)
MKRGTKNSVLVELEKLSDDEYQFGSGVKLYINTSYKPEQHQRIYGTCVAVPEMLTKGDQVKYEPGDFRFADSVEPEVKLGDRVYFSYVAVHKGSIVEYEGKSYCNIPYSAILCVVRTEQYPEYGTTENGDRIPLGMNTSTQIIPIGGWILCEEYWGKDAAYTEVEGRKVFGQVSSSGLITSIINKPSQKEAIVRIIGTPLKEDVMEVSVGDIVTFPNKFGFKNNIEGTDYLFLKYWDIQAIVGSEQKNMV